VGWDGRQHPYLSHHPSLLPVISCCEAENLLGLCIPLTEPHSSARCCLAASHSPAYCCV
jgi:hypothetical protein